MICKKIKTPIGTLYIFAASTGLKRIDFESSKYLKNQPDILKNGSPEVKTTNDINQAESICLKTEKQLQEYFAGSRKRFDIPLDPDGSPFQKLVWDFLYTIPYGKLVSYKTVAKGINKTNACRAVGNANGKNPISIIIPCHRVISADKSFGGYSSGLKIKKYLINLEKALPVDNL